MGGSLCRCCWLSLAAGPWCWFAIYCVACCVSLVSSAAAVVSDAAAVQSTIVIEGGGAVLGYAGTATAISVLGFAQTVRAWPLQPSAVVFVRHFPCWFVGRFLLFVCVTRVDEQFASTAVVVIFMINFGPLIVRRRWVVHTGAAGGRVAGLGL